VGVLREYRDQEDCKTSGELWLQVQKSQEGIASTPSGLQYTVLQSGSPTSPPMAGSKGLCEIAYSAWRIDGIQVMEAERSAPVLCKPDHTMCWLWNWSYSGLSPAQTNRRFSIDSINSAQSLCKVNFSLS